MPSIGLVLSLSILVWKSAHLLLRLQSPTVEPHETAIPVAHMLEEEAGFLMNSEPYALTSEPS